MTDGWVLLATSLASTESKSQWTVASVSVILATTVMVVSFSATIMVSVRTAHVTVVHTTVMDSGDHSVKIAVAQVLAMTVLVVANVFVKRRHASVSLDGLAMAVMNLNVSKTVSIAAHVKAYHLKLHAALIVMLAGWALTATPLV
jgi:hypothetical protein